MNGARYAYLRRICNLVEQGEDIVIVSEDYAAPMFDEFREKYPQRFLSVGIAEQNGVAVACGLALAGKYPIVYGCAPFPLTRAIDQVKSAVAGMHLPMTILNSGIGFGVPEFGATHFNVDDIAMIRGIPGVRAITPTDNLMAERLANFSIESRDPLYVRFDKNCEGNLYSDKGINFHRGFQVVSELCKSTNLTIVSCGSMIQEILRLVPEMLENGINAKVIDLYSLPFDDIALLSEIGYAPILTVEEHIKQGGIGSAVLETVNTYAKGNAVARLGIDLGNGYPSVSGSREYFLEKYGLSAQNIISVAKELCRGCSDSCSINI